MSLYFRIDRQGLNGESMELKQRVLQGCEKELKDLAISLADIRL
jgi:hypothetical protein